jgi:hypothetical protein
MLASSSGKEPPRLATKTRLMASPPPGRDSSMNFRRSLHRVRPYSVYSQDQAGRASRTSVLRSLASGSHASGMSSQSSFATGSGSQRLDSPLPQEFLASTQPAESHVHPPNDSSWIPEGRPAVRHMTDLENLAPGCFELVDETRVFYLAEIFFVRRCAWDDNMVAIARECLNTMVTVRARYMRTKRHTDPACLPLEPGGHSLHCFLALSADGLQRIK